MGSRLMKEVLMSAIPLRTDYDATDVRGLARKANDPDQVRRLLAIAAVYDGMRRAEATACKHLIIKKKGFCRGWD